MTAPLTIEVDVTPVLHAIDRAVLRLQGMTNRPVAEYAKAALQELGNIARAKQDYDERTERAQKFLRTSRDEDSGSYMR